MVVPGDTPEEDVVVRVVEISVDRAGVPRVRLEVKAHPEQAIWRGELWRRLEREGATDVRSRRG